HRLHFVLLRHPLSALAEDRSLPSAYTRPPVGVDLDLHHSGRIFSEFRLGCSPLFGLGELTSRGARCLRRRQTVDVGVSTRGGQTGDQRAPRTRGETYAHHFGVGRRHPRVFCPCFSGEDGRCPWTLFDGVVSGSRTR